MAGWGTQLDAVVTALLECVRVALAATAAGQPDRVCEVAGELAWDDCDCGVLAVGVDRLYPSRVFPQEASAADFASGCQLPFLVADLTVTVLRCAPGPDRAGGSPSCPALDTAARTWLVDADAVRRSTACCVADLRAADTVAEFTLRDQIPLGPEGGCVGSAYHLSVALDNCGCLVAV